MSQVYFMCWKDNTRKTAVSIYPKENVPLVHEMISILDGRNDFPYECTFKKIVIKENGIDTTSVSEDDLMWQDYPPNSFAWPIFSKSFRDIIDSNLTGKENLDWLTITVGYKNTIIDYYLLRFNQLNNVINNKKTLFVENTDQIIRPSFIDATTDNYNIFTIPRSHNLWKISSDVYVNQKMKDVIVKKKIKGVEFTKCRMS